MPGIADQLIVVARDLAAGVYSLKFKRPVAHVYNPLDYAWAAHEKYLRKFGNSTKRVIFLGMNPGPFGMAQTGIPFGEISAVRDWLGIHAEIKRPELEHPKRPISGFDCARSEVSGRRLWKLFADRYGPAEQFFKEHFVVNYCPLAFCGQTGCNLTPDKLHKTECEKLFKLCDQHLHRVLQILEPEWLIGIGGFAARRAETASVNLKVRIGQILHPSPASPAANRGWAKIVKPQLQALGVWK
jgi:single-strand selective monofunctional uracil DNA glycosylase